MLIAESLNNKNSARSDSTNTRGQRCISSDLSSLSSKLARFTLYDVHLMYSVYISSLVVVIQCHVNMYMYCSVKEKD